MKKAVTLFLVIGLLAVYGYLYAGQAVKVGNLEIPLIEGAVRAPEAGPQAAQARIATFRCDKPQTEVILFYETYLEENNFQCLGGEEPDGFNVAARKADTLFTLRIFTKAGYTFIQFVW